LRLSLPPSALRGFVPFDDPLLIPYAHGKVGVAAMALLWAQALSGLARPRAGVTSLRRAWEYAHALLGRCAITLGAQHSCNAVRLMRSIPLSQPESLLHDARCFRAGIVNLFTGIYILGRELRLAPFNTWAGWSAFALGVVWLAGAALQKTMDQSERVRRRQQELCSGAAASPLPGEQARKRQTT